MADKRKNISTYHQIERLLYIHKTIASGTYPTTKKIAKDLETSTATISRDIDFLRDRQNAPIEYDTHRGGYFYSDPKYQLSFNTTEDLRKIEEIAKIAEDKQSFSDYLNYPIKKLDKLELITDLGLPNQTILQSNLTKKYIGRNYFLDACTWIGLKQFDFTPVPLLTLSYFEDYKMNPKEISFHLQGTKLNYIAEECSYDGGYWLYIILENRLLEISEEAARMELKALIQFTRKDTNYLF